MSTETFEARALAAGTALRTAFMQDARPGSRPADTYEGGPIMSTATPTTPVQPLPPTTHRRRRPAAWAAVAALVVAAGTAGAIALTADNDPGDRLLPADPPAVVLEGCPFTAGQVSGAIGVTVTGPHTDTTPGASTDCSFGPGLPGVYFYALSSSACTPESRRSEADFGPYSDAVDGLGFDAYSNVVSLGASLLVCNGDRPFSVLVNGIQGDDLTAAVELASLVLNG